MIPPLSIPKSTLGSTSTISPRMSAVSIPLRFRAEDTPTTPPPDKISLPQRLIQGVLGAFVGALNFRALTAGVVVGFIIAGIAAIPTGGVFTPVIVPITMAAFSGLSALAGFFTGMAFNPQEQQRTFGGPPTSLNEMIKMLDEIEGLKPNADPDPSPKASKPDDPAGSKKP